MRADCVQSYGAKLSPEIVIDSGASVGAFRTVRCETIGAFNVKVALCVLVPTTAETVIVGCLMPTMAAGLTANIPVCSHWSDRQMIDVADAQYELPHPPELPPNL